MWVVTLSHVVTGRWTVGTVLSSRVAETVRYISLSCGCIRTTLPLIVATVVCTLVNPLLASSTTTVVVVVVVVVVDLRKLLAST